MFEDDSWNIEVLLANKLLGATYVETGHTKYAATPPTDDCWLKEGIFFINWDSKNMQAVKQKVDQLLEGCACKGGCNTDVAAGRVDHHAVQDPGCRCVNCTNSACACDNLPKT